MKPSESLTTVLDTHSQNIKTRSQSSKSDKYKITYNKKAESEFFVDNSALAGFTGERILYMAIRELIENALDSCESFSISPSIKISLKTFDQTNDLWTLSCEDNGTGISSDKLPVAVCSFLTSAKYMEKQQRGLFGVGLKMVAAFSTKDTDFPIKVWNKSIDEDNEYYFELRTDIGTNKPIVLSKKILSKHDLQIKDSSGIKIEVILRAKLVPITKNKIYDYVTQTSIVNPYALIIFETDDGIFHFDRRTSVMPAPAQEILPHPSDMDLKTLKKAISKFVNQKISLPKILSSSFQKLSYEKAKEIVSNSGLESKSSGIDFSEHDLIKIVNICKKTRFQNPNTDHLSPIGQQILTIGMMSEYTIVSNKNNDTSVLENHNTTNTPQKLIGADNEKNQLTELEGPEIVTKNIQSKSNFSVKVLKPVLTAYTSRTCVINNRPTIVETGLAYGGDIPSFKLYRFANKIPLLYDEGSDVAREVISEVEINKMGITKKQAKEQFSTNKESKKDRVIEVLPIHIFFHVCSTKIPYKTAGKESIASEGELKYYMKSCLSELYRKLSSQIRKEIKLKEAENKLRLYKHYLPFIVDAIDDSLGIKNSKLSESFSKLIENHLAKKSSTDESIDYNKLTSSDTAHHVGLEVSEKVDRLSTKDDKFHLNKKNRHDQRNGRKNEKTNSIKDHKKSPQVITINVTGMNKHTKEEDKDKQVKKSTSVKQKNKVQNNPNKEPKKIDGKLSYTKTNKSKTQEIQATMDFYSKRVNKGKRK